MDDVTPYIFAVKVLGWGGHLALAATSPNWEGQKVLHWGPVVAKSYDETPKGWGPTSAGLPGDTNDYLAPWRDNDGNYLALTNPYAGLAWQGEVSFETWEQINRWSLALEDAAVPYDPFGWGGYNSNSAIAYVATHHLGLERSAVDFSAFEPWQPLGVDLGRWFPGWNADMPVLPDYCPIR